MFGALILAAVVASQTPERAVLMWGQSVSVGVNDSQVNSTPSSTSFIPTKNEPGGSYCGYAGCFDVPPTAWPLIGFRESTWVNTTTGTLSESPRGGMVEAYTAITGKGLVVIHSGVGGWNYSQLKRGTRPWEVFERSIEALGSRTTVRLDAAVVIQGESDYADNTATYLAKMLELQSDITAKVNRSTSYKGDVVVYLSQPSSWSNSVFGTVHSQVPDAMYAAAKAYPLKFKLVGSQYDLNYRDANHPNTASSVQLGRRIGRALADPNWQPVWPLSVTRSGAVITVSVYAPVPPLVHDTQAISNPGNYGFTYTDDSNPPAISSVDCTTTPCAGNTCTCLVTLASTPTGANKKLRYAYTSPVPTNPGPTTGPRGCIADSAVGIAGANRMVHFEEVVP